MSKSLSEEKKEGTEVWAQRTECAKFMESGEFKVA